MQPLSIKITANYGLFQFIEGNRAIAHQVARLVTEIQWKNQLHRYPILVHRTRGGKLEIADGQKRFEAAKELNLPIHYIEDPDKITIEEIARANSRQTGWSLLNYLHYHATLGARDYLILQAFLERWTYLPISTAIEILGGTANGTSRIDAFKEGDFRVRDRAYANSVASALCAIQPHLQFRIDRWLVGAVSRAMRCDEFSVTKFLYKLSSQSLRLVKCSSWRDYLRVIEAIYNRHSRTENRLSFGRYVKGFNPV